MPNKSDVSVKFRIWFFAKDEKLVGKGRIELLQLIHKTGSIAQAAKIMKMSYRQAWQMVKEMNECTNKIFVEKKLGGKSGGGAHLTQSGIDLIKTFEDFQQKVDDFIKVESKKIKI